MAQRVLLRKWARPFRQFEDEKETDKLTLHGHSIGGDDDVIE